MEEQEDMSKYKCVEVDEWPDRLYEMLGKLEYGVERMFIITQNGVPVAKLVDYHQSPYEERVAYRERPYEPPDFSAYGIYRNDQRYAMMQKEKEKKEKEE